MFEFPPIPLWNRLLLAALITRYPTQAICRKTPGDRNRNVIASTTCPVPARDRASRGFSSMDHSSMIRNSSTLVALVFSGALCAASAQTPCENLKSLTLPNVTFKSVESIPAGPFQAPQAPGRGAAPAGRGGAPPLMLPAYCRAAIVLAPSADSHIEMELWLPATDWNGKFQAVGNGGWAGSITFPAMAQALKEGYATASNDTGHTGQDPAFALHHPEKLVDFAYRANHEMTVQSKALINEFYGKSQKLAYWNGCSTGGRQGLMEAQKYPADFDA